MAPCNDLGRQGWRHGAVWGARGGAIQRFGAPGVAPYKSMQLHTPSARRELLEGRWVLPKGLQICMTLLIVMPMLCCVYKLHVQTQWNSHVAILDSVPNENAHRSPQCMHKLLMAYNMCGRYKYASSTTCCQYVQCRWCGGFVDWSFCLATLIRKAESNDIRPCG